MRKEKYNEYDISLYLKFREEGRFITKTFGGLMNKVFVPNHMDKNFWTDEHCNGCGSCAKLCPVENIIMEYGKPKWLHHCELCLGCIHWCPKVSIQYKKGTLKRGRYHHPKIKIKEIFRV